MLSRTFKQWLPHEDDILVKCAAEGISEARISVKVGRAISSVRVRAKELGVCLPSKSQIRIKNGLKPHGEWARSHLTRCRLSQTEST